MIDKNFITKLVCPKCKSALKEAVNKLICLREGCQLEFEIKEGIPIMLVDESSQLHQPESVGK